MDKYSAGRAQRRRSGGYLIREVRLLSDEKVIGLLDGSAGLVESPTESGPLMALTDRRVITLVNEEDRHETRLASVDNIQAVSMRTHQRPFKPLLQGVVLILVGILVYLIVGAFSTGIPVNTGITIGALLGGAVALLGLLYILRFLFWEQGGELTFQTAGLELVLPYNSRESAAPIQAVLHRFFQLQAEKVVQPLYPHTTAPGWPPLLRMPPPPAPPPPKEAPAPTPPPQPATPRIRERQTWRRRVRPWMPALRLLRRDLARSRGSHIRNLRLRRGPLSLPRPAPRKTRAQMRDLRELIRHRRYPCHAPGRSRISRRRRGVR